VELKSGTRSFPDLRPECGLCKGCVAPCRTERRLNYLKFDTVANKHRQVVQYMVVL